MAHAKKASPPFQLPAISREKVERLIEGVQSGKFNERELINLYDNAHERDISEAMEAIELKMRADFPRAATRKFGPKEKARKTVAASD